MRAQVAACMTSGVSVESAALPLLEGSRGLTTALTIILDVTGRAASTTQEEGSSGSGSLSSRDIALLHAAFCAVHFTNLEAEIFEAHMAGILSTADREDVDALSAIARAEAERVAQQRQNGNDEVGDAGCISSGKEEPTTITTTDGLGSTTAAVRVPWTALSPRDAAARLRPIIVRFSPAVSSVGAQTVMEAAQRVLGAGTRS